MGPSHRTLRRKDTPSRGRYATRPPASALPVRRHGGATMSRIAQVACAATVIMSTAAIPVLADPIHITGGSVFIATPEVVDLGNLDIVGTQSFHLTSAVSPSGGSQGPFERCGVPECSPGTRIAFDIGLSGSAGQLPRAVMTIGGDRYDDLESQTAMANVFL